VLDQQEANGGCINNGSSLRTESGERFFLKTNPKLPSDMFAREAEGLAALSAASGPRYPVVYLVGADFLLLEDLRPGGRAPDYWTTLGRQLAAQHATANERFGFEHDNYLGSTMQPNGWMEDGYAFFAERRLIFQARLARDKGLLNPAEVEQAEALATRLPELIPPQPAALLHGDLWGGNAISDTYGQPALIDPAAHYGWPEAELGMTQLFGGFAPDFYAAYEAAHSLEPGWRERLDIYNLYHLVNHLNLFGRSYHGRVAAILQAFS
jgi:fructosamine-3-kinase